MRAVIQRVKRAEVSVDGEVLGAIGEGVAALVAVETGDGPEDLAFIQKKLVQLRIFNDARGKMNLSLRDTGGALLLISQFTLFGDCRRGNRPSFSRAAAPERAEELYQSLITRLRETGIEVQTGRFQAMMEISLVNDGPVTLLLDSRKKVY